MKLNFKKLVDKITDKKQPLNDRFTYYGHEVFLTSGTNEYVNVYIKDVAEFSFDFWTKKLKINFFENKKDAEKVIERFSQHYKKTKIAKIKYQYPKFYL